MKLRTLTYSLIATTFVGVTVIPETIQTTKNIEVNNDLQNKNDVTSPITAPNPLKDPYLMMDYFLPSYSNAAADFVKPVSDTVSDKWLYDLFPRLYIEDPNNKGQLLSATFKQIFVSEDVAEAIASKINTHFTADSPILDIEGAEIKQNYLTSVGELDLSGCLCDASSSNSPEQLLAAVFLNPWLYASKLVDDGGLPTEYASSYCNVDQIDLSVDKLTSFPVNVFKNLIENSSNTRQKLEINIDHNQIAILDTNQFGQNTNLNVVINADSNRIKKETYQNFETDIAGKFKSFSYKSPYESSGQDQHDFFYQINPNDDYFFTIYIEKKYGQNQRWRKILLNDNKGKLIPNLIEEIDKLNLYSNPLGLASCPQNLTVDYNDWSGRLTINVAPNDFSEHKSYVEDVYVHSITWPFIIYVLIIFAGAAFIYKRAKSIVKQNKKK